MSPPEPFEVFAIRYAHHGDWPRPAQFLEPAGGGGESMAMDFYCWVAVGPKATFIIDTGCDADEAGRRGHDYLRSPIETLSALGVDVAAATDLILTHLHYDHVGNLAHFPAATMHLQEQEIDFATGPYMSERKYSLAYCPEHVGAVIGAVEGGRVRLYDGDADLAPGLSIHRVGGHTSGMQVVRVLTRRGWVVIASDAIHYYEELERGVPWTNAVDLGDMLAAHATLRGLADSEDHIVAAHDPRVLGLYPAPTEAVSGYAVRLDVAPADYGPT